MRVAPAVVLSPEERTQLHRWSRSKKAGDYRAVRARIVLAAAAGAQDLEIARRLGTSRQTSARWRRRFLAQRLRGIDRRASARLGASRIPEDRVALIVRAATARDPVRNRPWSTRRLAQTLQVSHTTIRRVWESHRLRPVRFDVWPPRPDPTTPLGPTDVVGVYLRPPDLVVAFALGSDRRGSSPRDLPWIPGATRPPSFLRSVPPVGALPVALSFEARSREFVRFLTEVAAVGGPDRDIGIVASLPGLETGPEVDRWRLRHPNFRFELLVNPDRWRERLLPSLAEVGRRPGGSRTFGARGELARALRLFLEGYTAASGPYQWVATPRDIVEEEAGFRLRYDLSVTGHPGFKSPRPVTRAVSGSLTSDPRAREMARVVLRKSLGLRKEERVTIETWTETLEYANAFVLEALRLGARPLLLYQDEPTYWAAASEVRPANLARLGEHQRAALERSDVLVTFFGPSDRERFHALPRPTMFKLSEYRDALYRAAARGGARAVQMALGRASEASARMYGVDLADWRNELVEGTLVDPEELHRRSTLVSRRLKVGREVQIHHANGTQLTLGLRHRTPQVSDGRVPRARARGAWDLVQLPAGVVMVALDERVAQGTFRSNVPNSVGVMDTIAEVVGGRWTFENGRLKRFNYERGQEMFSQSYDRGGVGRDRPGMLSIGLNEKIRTAPLLQDQAYGAVTLQLGRNEHAGGSNRGNWWAWLILRGADLSVDGEPLLKGGRIVP